METLETDTRYKANKIELPPDTTGARIVFFEDCRSCPLTIMPYKGDRIMYTHPDTDYVEISEHDEDGEISKRIIDIKRDRRSYDPHILLIPEDTSLEELQIAFPGGSIVVEDEFPEEFNIITNAQLVADKNNAVQNSASINKN